MKQFLFFTIGILALAFFSAYAIEFKGGDLSKSIKLSANIAENISNGGQNQAEMEKVKLTTSDGVEIAGDYYPGAGLRGVLLVHMMPATKESWQSFARMLQGSGFNVLAIDLRGHGASVGGPDGYKGFTDADHPKSILDVEAGVSFLKSKDIGEGNISIAGASIGANLALWYLSKNAAVRTAVLLSPGLNYRGVQTEPYVKSLHRGQRVLFIGSEDDVRANGDKVSDMCHALYGLAPSGAEKKLIIYRSAGHGTDMFGKEKPDLASEVLAWIKG